jgi:hypothetical protein
MGDEEVVVKSARVEAIRGRVGETPWGCEDLPAEADSALCAMRGQLAALGVGSALRLLG